MVPTNVLQRTFQIKHGDKTGTCFTIDQDGKQYIITARHVVSGFKPQQSISVSHQKQWKDLPCEIVGLGDGDVDIAVLAPPYQISPTHPLPATTALLYLGQDAYFLGFPYGLHTDVGALNADFPLPLIKKACVSSMNCFPGRQMNYVLLDGHNNPGFSGGPVVFYPPGRIDQVKVGAVISSYKYEWDPVFLEGKQTPLAYRYNTSIIVAFAIEYAVNLIKANPIGASVT